MRSKPSFHEDYRREHAIKSGSDRAFGLTVGTIFLVIVLYRWVFAQPGWIDAALVIVGGPLVLLGFVAPRVLAPLNRAWTRLGLLLFKVVNPVVLFLIFVTAVLPIGLIMRAFGKDFLLLRRNPEAASYWIERRPPGPKPDGMREQF